MGQLQMEIDCINVASGHGRKFKSFAGSVGTSKIEAKMVPQHESDIWQCEMLEASDTDSHHDRRFRLQNRSGVPERIENRYPEYFRPSVTKPVVNVGNMGDYLRREIWTRRALWRLFISFSST